MTNKAVSGNSVDRRRRKLWLLKTYAADVHFVRLRELGVVLYPAQALGDLFPGAVTVPTCRCYRCGTPLHYDILTVDKIIPQCEGGTYRRNNIRPACGTCNSSTGGKLGAARKASR